jgi:hypothetical protein
MGTICLNLIDGTCVVGKQVGDRLTGVELEEPLLMTTSNYAGVGTKVYFTKYNIFGEDPTMYFNETAIITKYRASKYIMGFYKKFIDKAEKTEPVEPIDSMGENAENTATFLTEFEDMVQNTNKVDINDLRNTVQRIPPDEEDDDEDDDFFPEDDDE